MDDKTKELLREELRSEKRQAMLQDHEWDVADAMRAVERALNGRSQQVPQLRRFELHRDQDVSGVSGTGVVADGVQYPGGAVAICWRGERSSVVVWQDIADAMAVHGHGGSTRLVWID